MALQSASRTSDGQLVTGKGRLHGLSLLAGVDAATAKVYDNTSAAGTVIAVAGAAAGLPSHWVSPPEAHAQGSVGVPFNKGLYVDVSGTTPTVVAHYDA